MSKTQPMITATSDVERLEIAIDFLRTAMVMVHDCSIDLSTCHVWMGRSVSIIKRALKDLSKEVV